MKNPFEAITGIKIIKDEPISKHTSFHIGGNAKFFVRIYSIRALKRILKIMKKRKMKYL